MPAKLFERLMALGVVELKLHTYPGDPGIRALPSRYWTARVAARTGGHLMVAVTEVPGGREAAEVLENLGPRMGVVRPSSSWSDNWLGGGTATFELADVLAVVRRRVAVPELPPTGVAELL